MDLKKALNDDRRGFLGERHPAIARRIGPEFPNPDVVLAYTNPRLLPRSTKADFTRKEMDVYRIGVFCQHRFSFGGWKLTLDKLEDSLYTAVVTEALQQFARNKEFPRFLTGHFDIVKRSTRKGCLHFCLQLDCRIIVDTFHQGFDSGFAIDLEDESERAQRVWVHAYALAHSHHWRVADYFEAKRRPNPLQDIGVPVSSLIAYNLLFHARQ